MATDNIEILFVSGSSLDQKGARVLVRAGVVENTIWSGDGVQDVDMKLLGITEADQRRIEGFFDESRSTRIATNSDV